MGINVSFYGILAPVPMKLHPTSTAFTVAGVPLRIVLNNDEHVKRVKEYYKLPFIHDKFMNNFKIARQDQTKLGFHRYANGANKLRVACCKK